MKTLGYEEARAFYDRMGSGQDSQAFYEDRATDRLIAHADFARARAVFELGCGTGRFAETLLREHLGPEATYLGVDVSPVMVELATQRLASWADRARVTRCGGQIDFGQPDGAFDRFVSNFVLDLLSEDDIHRAIGEAARLLEPGGRLCVASLSPGHGVASRGVIAVWSLIHRIRPALVGGCRPIRVAAYLSDADWRIVARDALSPYGLPLEAVVAERLGARAQ